MIKTGITLIATRAGATFLSIQKPAATLVLDTGSPARSFSDLVAVPSLELEAHF